MRLKDKIYLDYQATTPTGQGIVDAMLPYFSEEFGNPHSTDHLLGWASAAAIDRSRVKVAGLIGADPEEIIFTSGATESINQVIQALAHNRTGGRNRILVSAVEHKCVLNAALATAELLGMTVEQIPVTPDGLIDIERYKALLDEDVVLVAVMAVNNEIGTIQPISGLTALAHNVGALFLCDAAQAPNAVDVDVFDWDVDFLSLSAHKIYGPKGVGALYVRKELLIDFQPLLYGGGQQGGLRAGTLPTPLCVGFGLAADEVIKNGASERVNLATLKASFVSAMDRMSIRYSLNGAQSHYCHPGNINVRFHGLDAHSLLTKLHPYLCASTGSACSSGVIGQSHVLHAIGLSREEAASSVRFSIGRYTDESQVEDSVVLISQAILALQSG